MKFLVELLRAQEGTTTEILHRVAIDEMNLKRAQFRAEGMLSLWRRRGATRIRISNHRGEELHCRDIC